MRGTGVVPLKLPLAGGLRSPRSPQRLFSFLKGSDVSVRFFL